MAIGLDNYNLPEMAKPQFSLMSKEPTYWLVNGDEADASIAVVVQDAPGTGLSLYVTRVAIFCNVAIAIHLEDNTGTPIRCLGPWTFTTTGRGFVDLSFNPKKGERVIKLAENKSLNVKGGAGQFWILVEGFTAE